MQTKRKKIIHVIESLGLGGAEKLLFETVKLLPEFDHVIVYFNKKESFDFSTHAALHHIPLSNNLLAYIKTAWRLRRFIQQQQPDMVHSHLWTSTLLARLATPKSIRLISTIHSIYSRDAFNRNPNSIRARVERITYRRYHEIIGVSKTVLQDYFTFIPKKGKAYLVYNFIHQNYFQTSTENKEPRNGLRMISVGNLRTVKNYDFLLQSLAQLPGNSMPYTLDIYGDGDLRGHLQSLIDRHQLPVRLLGHHHNIAAVLGGYDLFVSASHNEGFCLALAEAMAAGLPVLISDIPTFRELADGEAVFFSLKSPADFTEKLTALATKKREGTLHDGADKRQKHIHEISSQEKYRDRMMAIYLRQAQETPIAYENHR